MADNDVPRFKSGAVAKAIGMKPTVLLRWFDRGIAPLAGCDCASNGSGEHRLFTARTIYKLAIAHELTLVGIIPSKAIELAGLFADRGQRGREPGSLFKIGRTILAVSGSGGGIYNLLPDELFGCTTSGTSNAVVLVDCNRVVSRIDVALGLSPGERDHGAQKILAEFGWPHDRGVAQTHIEKGTKNGTV